jgi:hypothetical protein
VLRMRDCTLVQRPGPPVLLPSLTSLDVGNSSLAPPSFPAFLALLGSSGTALSHLCATLGCTRWESPGYGLLQLDKEADCFADVVLAVPNLTSLDLSGDHGDLTDLPW